MSCDGFVLSTNFSPALYLKKPFNATGAVSLLYEIPNRVELTVGKVSLNSPTNRLPAANGEPNIPPNGPVSFVINLAALPR
ncbi:hypothetical protein D3C78_1525070 [compost metagenome]